MKRELIPQFELNGSRIYQGRVVELLPELLGGDRRVVVVTDSSIDRLHHSLLGHYPTLLIGQGESAKTLKSVEELLLKMIDLGVDRSWFLLAIGGGVVTDLAGFVASTYMRGIRFGFIPTTLLGQVDASVGGKNGVNVGGYKNMIGSFNQPEFVLCDVSLLSTLPDREFRSGVAEVIKSALVGDGELFKLLMKSDLATLRGDEKLLQDVVLRAISVKVAIVERDERERGERRLLNLGHTFGHAIEKLVRGYSHGEAVAVGMVIAAEISEKLQRIAKRDVEQISSCISRYGLPLQVDVAARKLLGVVSKDKKGEGDLLHFVLPLSIGECETTPISIDSLAELI